MIFALLLTAFAAPPSQAEVDAWWNSFSHQSGESPVQFTIKGVGAERTVAEFMDVCVRPRWTLEKLQDAVRSSDFDYKKKHVNDHPTSFTWSSKRAYLVLNLNTVFSQCALSIGSIQPRTGRQILAMLKPAVEAELGHDVAENDQKNYLEWTDVESGYVERIELGGASSEPKQGLWFIFDRTAPGVREKLESKVVEPRPGEARE